jgi:hypothetical protein
MTARPTAGPEQARASSSAQRRTAFWILGLAVTVLCLWLAIRDVPLSEVAAVLARTHWPVLVLLGVPSQILAIYVRALRWRHLTDVIQPIPVFPLFRATSIGFMANNLLPGRAGEVIRAWVLSRETGASGAGILGTVVLERVIDSVTFLALASIVFWSGGTRALGSGLMAGAAVSLMVALILPVGVLVWLRFAPEQALGVMHRMLSWVLPARLSAQVEGLLSRFAEGLGSLRGGSHLFWVITYSVLLWGVISVIPFYAGVRALDIDLGSPVRTLVAGYVVLAAVGLAVALPAAPGFFGTFHLACKEALGVFGVPDSTAFAMAVLVHGTFWLTVTGLGLALLPFGRAGLRAGIEAAAADQDPDPDRR